MWGEREQGWARPLALEGGERVGRGVLVGEGRVLAREKEGSELGLGRRGKR